MSLRRVLPILATALALAACATGGNGPSDGSPERAAQYQQARQALQAGKLDAAREGYRKLLPGQAPWPPKNEGKSPVPVDAEDRYARAARLELGHVAFAAENYARAKAIAEAYLARYPDGPRRSHAALLAGKALHERARALRKQDELHPQFPDVARQAFDRLQAVLANYPEAGFEDRVVPRLTALREAMAAYEYGRLKVFAQNGVPQEVVARADYILEHYGDTPVAADAMAAQIRALAKLGKDARAAELKRRLRRRFPDRPVPETDGEDATS